MSWNRSECKMRDARNPTWLCRRKIAAAGTVSLGSWKKPDLGGGRSFVRTVCRFWSDSNLNPDNARALVWDKSDLLNC